MRGKGLSSLMVFAIGAAFMLFQLFMTITLLTNEEAKNGFNLDDLMFQSTFMFLPALFILVMGANNVNKKKLLYKYAMAGIVMLILAILLGIIQIFIGYNAMNNG